MLFRSVILNFEDVEITPDDNKEEENTNDDNPFIKNNKITQ